MQKNEARAKTDRVIDNMEKFKYAEPEDQRIY